jgi:hypothetical protein
VKFEDLDKDTIARYAKDGDPLAQIMFQLNPSMMVNLLGEVGGAAHMSGHLNEALLAADMAVKMGRARHEPLHDDLDAAIRAAVASVEMCFETVLDAVMIINEAAKNCKCVGCQRRRQVQVAEQN